MQINRCIPEIMVSITHTSVRSSSHYQYQLAIGDAVVAATNCQFETRFIASELQLARGCAPVRGAAERRHVQVVAPRQASDASWLTGNA